MKNFIYLIMIFFITSCTCNRVVKLRPVQVGDKDLSCKNIVLGINEAEYHRKIAADAQKINFGKILLPLCWVADFNDGKKGVKAAHERIQYLRRIYKLLDCSGNLSNRNQQERSVPQKAPSQAPSQFPYQEQTNPNNARYNPNLPQQRRQPQDFSQKVRPTPQAQEPNINRYNQNTPIDLNSAPSPSNNNTNDPNLHIHVDVNNNRLQHSHEHQGYHMH